jgi:hypothetical protein
MSYLTTYNLPSDVQCNVECLIDQAPRTGPLSPKQKVVEEIGSH